MVDLRIGVLPFMVGMAILITLLFMFPRIALWLPNGSRGSWPLYLVSLLRQDRPA